MHGTQGAHLGRGGGWGAGLSEGGGNMCKNAEFCTNYSRNEPAALSRDARREDASPQVRSAVHRDGAFNHVELQLFRRRCRDGVVEMVNPSAHQSTATDEGSQRNRCALAHALPKQRR
eukprot:3995957-Prymnesium_polylepis.1